MKNLRQRWSRKGDLDRPQLFSIMPHHTPDERLQQPPLLVLHPALQLHGEVAAPAGELEDSWRLRALVADRQSPTLADRLERSDLALSHVIAKAFREIRLPI